MAFGVHAYRLVARQGELDRPSDGARHDRRLTVDSEVFFRPERASVGDQRDVDVFFFHAQEPGDLPTVVPDALAPRQHMHDPVMGPRNGRLGFQERVLDELGIEGLGDDVG